MKLFWGFALASLIAACDPPKAPTPPAKTRGPKDVVVKVNGVPILREDVERLAKFVQASYYNLSFDYACTAAIGNSLIPRAACISKFQDMVEPLHVQIDQVHAKLKAGEDFGKMAETISDYPLTVSSPSQEIGVLGKMDYLLSEWLAVLKPGEISEPILTKLGWIILRLDPEGAQKFHLRASVNFQSILLAFDKEAPYANAQKFVDEAKIEIIDPDYEKIVPEWVKFGPGRQTKTVEVQAKPKGD